jgi:hypothetical protein
VIDIDVVDLPSLRVVDLLVGADGNGREAEGEAKDEGGVGRHDETPYALMASVVVEEDSNDGSAGLLSK